MPQERLLVEPDLNLAFRPSLVEKRFEELMANSPSREEAISRTYDLCREDLTYYFLEQFARKKLVNYHYKFVESNGERIMVSGAYEPLGDVTALFASAAAERERIGLDISREAAELEGFLKIKRALLSSNQPTSLVLVSPPPTDAERTARPGYADYSFIYFGLYDPETQNVDMYAWRNNMGLDEQVGLVNEYASEAVISAEAQPNDFLRNPVFKFGSEAIKAHAKYLAIAGKVAEFAPYRTMVDKAVKDLVDAVASEADSEQLNMVVANIELEFIKIVNAPAAREVVFEPLAGKFQDKKEAYGYLAAKYQEVDRQYDVVGYGSGGCGGSMFSRLDFGRQVSILSVSVLADLVTGGLKDKYGTREIRCEECGATYTRDYNKLEERCRKCGGTKGIVC